MSTAKSVITVEDATTFTLNEADLTGMNVGQFRKTQKRDVRASDDLKWWIQCFPAGGKEMTEKYVSVFLYVNKPVKAKHTFAVNDSLIKLTSTNDYEKPPFGFGCYQFASHEQLRPLFRDGKVTVTCSVEFFITVPFTPPAPRVFQLFQHVPTDVELVVGSDRVQAHKNFLSMISPVFHAMFFHDTVESKTKEVELTDVDIATVKSTIGLCYGYEAKELSVEAIIKVLRFCDKYFITAVMDQFEPLPLANLSTETFCDIIRYACDCNQYALLAECINFFKKHQSEITKLKEFADLPSTLVIFAAFELETRFDVLRRAHKDGIDFVVNYLEQPLLKSMSIDDFCPAVNYAWDCSRDELKKVCAKYFVDNRDEVLDLKAFNDLPSDTIRGVLKSSYVLKNGDN